MPADADGRKKFEAKGTIIAHSRRERQKAKSSPQAILSRAVLSALQCFGQLILQVFQFGLLKRTSTTSTTPVVPSTIEICRKDSPLPRTKPAKKKGASLAVTSPLPPDDAARAEAERKAELAEREQQQAEREQKQAAEAERLRIQAAIEKSKKTSSKHKREQEQRPLPQRSRGENANQRRARLRAEAGAEVQRELEVLEEVVAAAQSRSAEVVKGGSEDELFWGQVEYATAAAGASGDDATAAAGGDDDDEDEEEEEGDNHHFGAALVPAERSVAAEHRRRLRGNSNTSPWPDLWPQAGGGGGGGGGGGSAGGGGDGGGGAQFVTPADPRYSSLLATCYRGFHTDPPKAVPQPVHARFGEAFGALDAAGIFARDVIEPSRGALTRTHVARALVGAPGMTYRYLGIRIFAHPWSGPVSRLEAIGEGGGARGAAALRSIGELNSELAAAAASRLKSAVAAACGGGGGPAEPVGSCEFTLTLINVTTPEAAGGVSWHADGGLQDFSTIAVYQQSEGLPIGATSSDWAVGLRAVASDGGAAAPPALVPQPSGTLYYLLDDFNHHHEHAVLPVREGARRRGRRYSSTHRVALEVSGEPV